MNIEGVPSNTEAMPPFMEAIGKLLVPYQMLSLLKIPLAGYEIVKRAKHVIKAPKHLKLYPILKILESLGGFFEGFIAGIGIAKHFGAITFNTVSVALGPIGGVAVALHLAKGATSIWNIYRVDRQWRKFQGLLGRKEDSKHEPTEEELKAAIDYITKEFKTGSKSYDFKFFGLYKKPAQEKVSKIYERFQEGTLTAENLETTFKSMRRHYIHRQTQHALEIALMIISAVGTLVLIFAPTPAAPAAWGILAISGVLMLSFYLYKYLQNRQFTHELKEVLKKASS